MNKYELSAEVARQLNVPINSIQPVIEKTVETIMTAVKKEQRVVIAGFGIFHSKKFRPSKGNLPGAERIFPARTKSTFKPSKEFKYI